MKCEPGPLACPVPGLHEEGMTSFALDPPAIPSVSVAGEDARFPVRRIFCVGRNYADHAREMGSDPDREPPFFFTKPADAAVDGGNVAYPPLTLSLHHEVELVVAIGVGGTEIAEDAALGHVFGYAVGLDLTRRDLQTAAKASGRPWDWAKGFDQSAPIGAIRRVEHGGHPARGRIWLSIGGSVRQEGDLSDMIWSVPSIIAAASRAVRLAPGDLIMTGTPAGVGPIERGETVRAGIDGIGELVVTVG